ncbi:MAG: DoxX family protein [Opitutales bacterium]|jgi:putative oxidoreductase|nr:DoxX family protein [Opitutales bacterium]MBT5167878.1 DoxX family protein [Opitutales bacterium]MBT5814178.1 DoxX family protein [Opitutales bacterium]MBT6380381.1 DoxX family protein [Opitutales bacterium]MBT6767556.1 DoxX family protein [Opitutales bacterium]
MNKIIEKLASTNNALTSLPLRFGLGIVMAAHGSQKLFGSFGGYGLQGTAGFFENSLGMKPGILFAALAGGTEFFGGLLLIIGLATRPAAALIGITMLVALISVHSGSFFAPEGMEYLLVLISASISLIINGGGAWSIDHRISTNSNASL